MQSTTSTWDGIFAGQQHITLFRAVINGQEYGYDDITTARINRKLFESPSIGNAAAAALEMTFFPRGEIPRTAEIQTFVQLSSCDETVLISDESNNAIMMPDGTILASAVGDSSEWLPFGTFYIDTRQTDAKTGLMSITAYDKMLFAEAPYYDQMGTYPMPMINAVQYICSELGIELDNRSIIYNGSIDSPTHIYTMREVLRFIAAASAGNWTITPANKLQLVPFAGPQQAQAEAPCGDYARLGRDMTVTRLTLYPDGDMQYTTGTDGFEVVGDCAYATEEVVSDVSARIFGVLYRPFLASLTLANPAVELGDSVTINSEDCLINNITWRVSHAMAADISSPWSEEIDNEIPFVGRSREERKLARGFSEIRKNTEEIALEVQGKVDENEVNAILSVGLQGVRTEFTSELNETKTTINSDINGIRQEVSGKLDGQDAQSMINTSLGKIELQASSGTNQSTITIMSDGVEIDSQVVTFSRIVADKVDAKNINGSLTSNQIDLYGDMLVYVDDKLKERGGHIGYTNGNIGSAGIHLINADETAEVVVTDIGARMCYEDLHTLRNSVYVTDDRVVMEVGGNRVTLDDNGGFVPLNPMSLGYSNSPWQVLYAKEGVIGGMATELMYAASPSAEISDAKKKTNISYDLSRYSQLLDALRPACYNLVDGTSGRTHLGLIAQDVEKALADNGISTTDFGGLVMLPQEDGNGYDYYLRYSEFLPLLLAEVQKLKKEVECLKSRQEVQ